MTQFNPQQQLAIDALGNNVMVSASAGAGKTTVLIARLMKRILQDGVRLDEIVAMTFTEKAAAEMKSRLLEALNNENTQNPSPFLQEQIALVETAHITTIHSFCLKIIKNYGYVLGVSPKRSQTILDDAGVAILREKAMDAVFQDWLANKPDESQVLLDTFSSNPIDTNGLKQALLKTASWLGEKKDPDQAINDSLTSYQATSFDQLPNPIQDAYFSMMIGQLSLLLDNIQSLIQIIDSDYEIDSAIAQQTPMLQGLFESLHAMRTAFMNHDISPYDNLLNLLDIKTKADGKNEAYKQTRQDLADLIDATCRNLRPLDDHFSLLNDQAPIVANLLEMTQDFMHAYNAIKIEQEAFDFSDFEVYALKILNANNQAVAKEFQAQFKEIMVDEFQDTNEYQDEIVRLISTGNNVFRVGDVKQSIYRFRGAKPHIMQKLIDTQDGENLFLSFNYRSKKHIVDYNNDVFANLMNLTQGIQYDENDHVSTGIPSQEKDSVPVEFHILERGDDKHDDSVNLQKARYIAQQIIEHHKQGHRFKDMVVIIRSHNTKVFLKRAFEDANIPHYIDAQSGFYQSDIIMDVRAFLNYINTPNDYYLVQILKSPFFAYSDDKLAHLRLHSDASLRKNLKTFDADTHATLKSLMQSWRHLDLVSVITQLINTNDTYRSLSLIDKTNLDFLLEKAVNYQKQFGSSVIGFLDFMKPLEDISSNEASALSDDADVVRAFTIHQSKGLQFPIVFFWTFGKDIVLDHQSILIHDDVLGIALDAIAMPYRIQTRNLLRDIVESKQNNEELEENLRLLYVALTRPQNKLIVVDVVKEFLQEPLSLSMLHNHKRKSELLYAASPITTVLKKLPADSIPTKVLDTLESTYIDTNFSFAFTHELDINPQLPNTPLDLNRFSRSGMAYGTLIHESIETLPNRTWTLEDLKAIDARYHKALLTYNTDPFTQSLYAYDSIFHEMPFTDREGEGIIDFYAIKDHHIVIVDFKTDNASSETLVERYTEQLSNYIKVIETVYSGYAVDTYIYSFYNQCYIKITNND